MNNLQKVFCAITGYDHNQKYRSSGDTYYFNLVDSRLRREQIKRYAEHVLNIYLGDGEITIIYDAIETYSNELRASGGMLSENAYLSLEV